MLKRAAAEHASSNPKKPCVTVTTQQSLPTTRSFHDNDPPHNSRTSPLRRSAPSFLNTSFDGANGAYKNPLQSTASRPSVNSRMAPTPKTFEAVVGSGVVEKIHAGVFFEEDDFDDDSELNLDDDLPVGAQVHAPGSNDKKSTLSTSATSTSKYSDSLTAKELKYPDLSNALSNLSPQQYSTNPPYQRPRPLTNSPSRPNPAPQSYNQPKPTNARSFVSTPSRTSQIRTSQIDWSSSPPAHKGTPPNAHLLRRDTATTANSTVEKSPESEEEEFLPVKRKNLPWSKEEQCMTNMDQVSGFRGGHDAIFTGNKDMKLPAHTRAQIETAKTNRKKYKAQEDEALGIKKDPFRFRQQKGANKTITPKDIPASQGSILKAKNSSKKLAKIFLSDEQKSVLKLVVEGQKSVFFTGSAGTGKSVLMREIIKELKLKYAREPDRVAVTASTGLAACNIGGCTLHSFSGIGLGKEPAEQLVKKIKRNAKSKQRWMRVKCLIIDEISMVDGDLFDKLDRCARIIRGNGRVFGGIQLIVTGDFFQLPPVPDSGKAAKFAFDAETWGNAIQHTIGLTHVFRQRDEEFASMLNEMRTGSLSAESVAKFSVLSRQPKDDGFTDATDLYPTRNEVASANGARMRNLGGEVVDYVAADGGSITDIEQRTRLLSNCMAEQTISLKKGAQVMLIKNLDETLVNGSIGRVIAFMDENTYDVYHEQDTDIQEFEDMMGGGDGLRESRNKLKSLISKDIGGPSMKWPLVRFKIADGSSRDLLCTREQWKIEQPNGEVQASRNQIPLILAWALSIHKAQGQTLERVRVNLQKIFEKGQAYVALSRATTREGLQVLNFDAKKVQAHPRVTSFYKSLYNITDINQMSASGPISVKGKGKSGEISTFLEDDLDDEILATY